MNQFNRRSFFATLLSSAGICAAAKPLGIHKPPSVDEVPWTGDDFKNMQPWSFYVAQLFENETLEFSEISSAQRFYSGKQWPEEQDLARKNAGRPVIVSNRIPTLVYGVLKHGGVSSKFERELLITAIVRRNRDAQMLHNYIISTLVEMERFKLPRNG